MFPGCDGRVERTRSQSRTAGDERAIGEGLQGLSRRATEEEFGRADARPLREATGRGKQYSHPRTLKPTATQGGGTSTGAVYSGMSGDWGSLRASASRPARSSFAVTTAAAVQRGASRQSTDSEPLGERSGPPRGQLGVGPRRTGSSPPSSCHRVPWLQSPTAVNERRRAGCTTSNTSWFFSEGSKRTSTISIPNNRSPFGDPFELLDSLPQPRLQSQRVVGEVWQSHSEYPRTSQICHLEFGEIL